MQSQRDTMQLSSQPELAHSAGSESANFSLLSLDFVGGPLTLYN